MQAAAPQGELAAMEGPGEPEVLDPVSAASPLNISIKVLIPWRISPISVANYPTLLSTTNPPIDPAADLTLRERDFDVP